MQLCAAGERARVHPIDCSQCNDVRYMRSSAMKQDRSRIGEIRDYAPAALRADGEGASHVYVPPLGHNLSARFPPFVWNQSIGVEPCLRVRSYRLPSDAMLVAVSLCSHCDTLPSSLSFLPSLAMTTAADGLVVCALLSHPPSYSSLSLISVRLAIRTRDPSRHP